MNSRIARLFTATTVVIITITAAAKLVSSGGAQRILAVPDPLLPMSTKAVLILVAIIELLVAFYCVANTPIINKLSVVAWFASTLVGYRLGLKIIGYTKPCSCMGSLTEALNIPPEVADTIMKGVLAYLLIGSYGLLFWLWKAEKWKSRNQESETGAGGAAIASSPS